MAASQQNGRDPGVNLRLTPLFAKPPEDRQAFLPVDAKGLVQPTRNEVNVRNAVQGDGPRQVVLKALVGRHDLVDEDGQRFGERPLQADKIIGVWR